MLPFTTLSPTENRFHGGGGSGGGTVGSSVGGSGGEVGGGGDVGVGSSGTSVGAGTGVLVGWGLGVGGLAWNSLVEVGDIIRRNPDCFCRRDVRRSRWGARAQRRDKQGLPSHDLAVFIHAVCRQQIDHFYLKGEADLKDRIVENDGVRNGAVRWSASSSG